jgi:hypothetical protein
MPTRLRLYGTENIGRTAPLVLVILPRFPSRLGRRGGAHVGVQRDWLLIQTHHRFLGIVRFFISLQHIFHLGDVLVIQFGHTPHFFPATA